MFDNLFRLDCGLYHKVNHRIHLEMMKQFEAENIEFVFPAKVLHVKKD